MFDNYMTKEDRNPKFGSIDEEMTSSFMDTGKKKIHMAGVIAMVMVWLLYVGYDRVIRVNLQKYQMQKARAAIKVEQVEAGRKAKTLLNKNVKYKTRKKVRRVVRRVVRRKRKF